MTIARHFTKDEIASRIKDYCASRGAILLYAAESGSRGWGFASPDSDYDGRFIYMWPKQDYLSPFETVDTLRMTGTGDEKDLDFEGWSLSKTLRSLRAGNPVTLEWVQSPVVYRDANGFGARLLASFGGTSMFCAGGSISHYAGMARSSLSFTQGTGSLTQNNAKKMMYALRSALCCLYVRELGTMPPMAWEDLLASQGHKLSEAQHTELAWLLDEKSKHDEHHMVPASDISSLHQFMQYALAGDRVQRRPLCGSETYEEFFRTTLEM